MRDVFAVLPQGVAGDVQVAMRLTEVGRAVTDELTRNFSSDLLCLLEHGTDVICSLVFSDLLCNPVAGLAVQHGE